MRCSVPTSVKTPERESPSPLHETTYSLRAHSTSIRQLPCRTSSSSQAAGHANWFIFPCAVAERVWWFSAWALEGKPVEIAGGGGLTLKRNSYLMISGPSRGSSFPKLVSLGIPKGKLVYYCEFLDFLVSSLWRRITFIVDKDGSEEHKGIG